MAAVFLAVVLVGALAVLAPASDVSEGDPFDADGFLGHLGGYCEGGWEAGVHVGMDDSTAFGIFKEFVIALPEEPDLGIPELDGIRADPGMTVEEFYDLLLGEDVTMDLSGEAYLKITCVQTDTGYTINIRVKGTLDVATAAQGGGTDSVRFDVTLASDLVLTRGMIPVSLVTNLRIATDSGMAASADLRMDVSDLSPEDIEAIVNGGQDDASFTVGVCYRMTGINDGETWVDGFEGLNGMTIPAGILGPAGGDIGEIVGTVADPGADLTYRQFAAILEQYGLFIPEGWLNAAKGAVLSFFSSLRQGGLDFYYIYDGSSVNTNLKTEIEAAVAGVQTPDIGYIVSASEPYGLSYHTSYDGKSIVAEASGAAVGKVPGTIAGLPVTEQDSTGPVHPGMPDESGDEVTIDGVRYVKTDSDDVVFAIITGNLDTVTVRETVTIGGSEFDVTRISVRDADIGTLSIGDRSVSIEDSNIGTLNIAGGLITWISDSAIGKIKVSYVEDARIFNLRFLNDLSEIPQMEFEGAVTTWGDIDLPGYTGVGSAVDLDGIRYRIQLDEGVLFANVEGASSETVTVHSSITVDGLGECKVHLYDSLDGVTSIIVEGIPEDFGIRSNDSIESVSFENESAVSVPSYAFDGCTSLVTVVLGGPIDTIEERAFYDCTELKTIEFKGAIDTICQDAFFPSSGRITSLVFEDDVDTIEWGAFRSYVNLTSVHFLGDVGTVEPGAFDECMKLESLTFDKNVGSISASWECHALSAISIGGNLGEVPDMAFRGLHDADDAVRFHFTVEGNIGSIGMSAFEGSALSGFSTSRSTMVGSLEEYAFCRTVWDSDPGEFVAKAEYSHPFAFYRVQWGSDSEGYTRYEGVSSGEELSNSVESEEGLLMSEHVVSLFRYEGAVVANLTGLFYPDVTSVTIPRSVTIDDTAYTVAAVGIGNGWFGGSESLESLTINDNVRFIGSGLSAMFEDVPIENVAIHGGKFHTVTEHNVVTIVEDGVESDEIVALLNTPSHSTEVYTVPDGVDVLDLHLFGNLSIETLDTNGARAIEGHMSSIDGLKCLQIGAALEELDVWNIPRSIEEITVDPNNKTFFAEDNVLYSYVYSASDEVESLELIAFPSTITGSYTIPSSVDVSGTQYDVTGIGYSAFKFSNLTKVIVPETVDHIGRVFCNSMITEIVLPSGLRYISFEAFDLCLPNINVHSADGSVYTKDGAIYFIHKNQRDPNVGLKELVTYLGIGTTLFVEDGTDVVNMGERLTSLMGAEGSIDIPYPQYIVLPEEVSSVDLTDSLEDDGHVTHILIPDSAVQDCNYRGVHWAFRSYTTSSDYGISFSESNGALKVSVAMKNTGRFTGIALDSKTYDSSSPTIPFADLFPEEMLDGYFYDGLLEVRYDRVPYTVTYVCGPGLDFTREVYDGGMAPVPDDPVRGGYVFDGWYTDGTYDHPYDFESPVHGDISVHAKWIPTYTFTVVTDICTVLIDYEEVHGSVVLPEGEYDVLISGDLLGEVVVTVNGVRYDSYRFDLYIDRNIEIEVVYLHPTINVTYLNDPVKGTADKSYELIDIGDGVTLPNVTANEGYRFVGWTLGFFLVPVPEYMPSEDTVFVAAYVKETDAAEVSVSIDNSKGKISGAKPPAMVGAGTAITLPSVDAKNGYTFIGWTVDGNVIEGSSYTVTDDTRLIALFEETPRGSGVNVYLHVDNSEGTLKGNKVISVTAGSQVELPDLVGKRGFTFLGWSVDGRLLPDGTLTVSESTTASAIFQRNSSTPVSHTVRFSVPSGQGTVQGPVVQMFLDGQIPDLPGVSAASGYRFDGWLLDGNAVPEGFTVTADTTLTASLSRVSVPGGSSGGGSGDPAPPVKPEPPEEPAGETTTVVDQDGNTVHETIKDDGSKVTVTEKTDGTSTKVEFKPIENGSQTTEEVYDSQGNLTGSTTVVEKEETTETGNTVQTNTQVVKDGAGNTTSEVTKVTSTSAEGDIKTDVTKVTDAQGNTTSESKTVIAAEVQEDGRAVIPEDTVAKAIDQMNEAADADASKTIQLGASGGNPDRTEVVLSPETMSRLNESGAEVEIAGDKGTIRMSSDVSTNFASSEAEVSMSVGTANRNLLTSQQQDRVGDSPVFELTATIGGDSVHELGGEVTVTLPYTLREGENPDDLRVFYLDDNGGLHVKSTVYDPLTHTVSFVTDHFSIYMIGNVGHIDEGDGGSDTAIYIAAAVAVIAVIAVAAVVLRKRL